MSFILKFLCLVFTCYQLFEFFCVGLNFNVTVDTISLGKSKKYILNNTVLYIIQVQNLSDIIETAPPRVSVKCENCRENNPLLVVVGQKKGLLTCELPMIIHSRDNTAVYSNVKRTLCPYDILNTTCSALENENKICDQRIHPVTISLTTSSRLNILVEVDVNLENNFLLQLNSNKSVQVSPSMPAFYLYRFESDNISSVLLHITSEDNICMIVAVENVSCPVFDLQENVGYSKRFQTVSRQGAFTVTKEEFPDGFYVVLVVTSNDNYCTHTAVNSSVNRTKNAIIHLSKNISSDKYIIAVSAALSLIALFCTVMYVIFYFLIRGEIRAIPNLDDELINDNVEVTSSAPVSPYFGTSPITPVPTTSGGDTLSIKTDSSLDEIDFDLVNDAELDKNIFRMKNYLYLCDLARKNPSVLKKKTDLYFRNLLTVATFYFLPVLQLVFMDQNRHSDSGGEETCYYNFLCSHPLWWFSDFNHVFSNIGYITFGGLFIVLTMMKEKVYKLKISSNRRLLRFYGIPQHFGLFYAMAFALIIEGIFSSCYHICPNHYNFQFDTSFMYVICTLCMIKIYQTRHPDVSANAYSTFSLLAAVIVLGMYGVFSSNLTFWILFTIIHLSTCMYLSLKIYYMGRFKLEIRSMVRWFKELQPCRSCHCRFFLPMFPSRFALLVLANICNWGLAIGSFVFQINNFSSYLLAIFMVNLLLYTTFYIIMKLICGEKLPLQSVIYILLATLCWSAALYFFFNKTISWRLTPAESKLYNQKCILLNFFDNHDIWHFISATAMFFCFMVLLTIDNDLTYVHRSRIVVF